MTPMKVLLSLACIATISYGYEAASITSNCIGTHAPLPTSINSLGLQLVNQLNKPGNYFISPLSVHSALSMTYLGTEGKTADEIESAFQLRETHLVGRELHGSYGKLFSVYGTTNDQYSLLVANGLFVQQGYPVKSRYVNGLKDYYRAVVKQLDFQRNGESAKIEINNWVADNTRNMIKELLTEPLSPSTKLAILNAVYFKGTWKIQFNKDETFEGPFLTFEKIPKRVEFMQLRKEKFAYLEDEETGYQFLEMPYKGGDIAMLVALPKPEELNPKLNMDSSLLCRINMGLKETKLQRVHIPKFRLEYSATLKESLQQIGIKKLFAADEADLSEMSDTGDLYVSDVFHKAVVEVNEEGSEAAAVTGVIIENRMGSSNPSFIANRPFLFYIVDKSNGVVLFNGRVADP